jgi:hypothetical protein
MISSCKHRVKFSNSTCSDKVARGRLLTSNVRYRASASLGHRPVEKPSRTADVACDDALFYTADQDLELARFSMFLALLAKII